MPEPKRSNIDDDAKQGVTRDARGRRVTLLDPFQMQLAHRYSLINRETLTRINDDLGTGFQSFGKRGVYVYYAVIAITVLVFIIRCVDVIVSSGVAALYDSKTLSFLPVFVVPFAAWFTAKYRRMARIRTVMLQHRRCPHCGYDLHAQVADAQRHVTCPECGCAWSMPEDDS